MMLKAEIARFLRTHRDGRELLYRFLDSIPQDRTEEEFLREREQGAVAHENAIAKYLTDYNARRRRQGLLPVDRHGKVIQ
jgi:hypothetical protein